MRLIILLTLLAGSCQSMEQRELAEQRILWRGTAEKLLDMKLSNPAIFPSIWESLPIQSIYLKRGVPKHSAYYWTFDEEEEGIRDFFWEYEVQLTSADYSSRTNKIMVMGAMDYEGAGSMKRIGEVRGAVGVWDFARLCLLAEDLNLFECNTNYPSTFEHEEFTQLKILMKDGTKFEIETWGNLAPLEVWTFCSVIDQILFSSLYETR